MAYPAPQRLELEAALKSAFNYDSLSGPFRNVLGRRLDQVVVNDAFDLVVPRLIEWAEHNGWERPLVRLMQEALPANDGVIQFFQRNREFPALLLPADRESLRLGLSASIRTYQQLKDFASAGLGLDLDQIVEGQAAGDSSSDLYLPFFIRWTDLFDRVEALINSALATFSAQTELVAQLRPLGRAVVSRRPASRMAGDDPFQAFDLDGKLLIGRPPLRNLVRRLTDKPIVKVLGVKGPATSGKSHSFYFIAYISERVRTFETVSVDLKEDGPGILPAELLRRMLRRMGRNKSVADVPKREDSASDARWIGDLADFLIGEIKDSQKLWVGVLDGFSAAAEPLTRELVRALVLRATREPLFRIILLEYSDDLLPQEVAGRFESEPIGPITEQHLSDFLLTYARSCGEEPEAEALKPRH